jgi:hypothetical protein
MKWSITKAKTFAQCPRKWYYSEIMANSRTKDLLRKEAYLLKQLKSIWSWRGRVVDIVIEKQIIPRIKWNSFPSQAEVIDSAIQLMDEQLEFGKAKRYREPDMTKTKVGQTYCAFYDLEYNDNLDEQEVQKAKEDVQISLRNLLSSGFFSEIASKGLRIIAQRSLLFQFAGANISGTPDLVVFFKEEPPLIVDWKVQAFGNTEHWLQLGIYALALSRVKPHNDFPQASGEKLRDPTSFRLVEYQLLKNKLREYSIATEDILDIEDYMFFSIADISRSTRGRGYEHMNINEFQTARFPDTCARCEFRKLCLTGGQYGSDGN